ncbi:MAG: DUF3108 domain-containing protein [Steroidobacteraceae bacterium]
MRALAACLLLVAAGYAQVATAQEPLRPFTARYSITWSGMSAGSTRLSLQRLPDGRWAYESRSEAKGLFRLAMPADLASRSVFRVTDGHIVPETFTADDGASSSEKDQQLTFDWTSGRVSGIAERKKVDLPAQPGLLDTMSVQVALMNDLLSGRTPERFVLVDTDKIKDYLYTREGTETIKTSVGEYHTVVFRSSRPGSKKGTVFWCSPELGYVPVRVERRDGDEVEWFMTLKEVEIQAR